MGDQEGADLGRAGLSVQHELEGFSGLVSAHALAGVFAAAHLAQQLLEALATNGQRAGHGLPQILMQCSGVHDPAGVLIVTNRSLHSRQWPLTDQRTQSPSNRPWLG